MPIDVQPTEDENIIIVKTTDPLDVTNMLVEVKDILEAALDECNGTLYYINDIRDVNISFGDMVSGMGLAFKGGFAVFNDPNLHIIIVSESSMVKMGSKAASQQSQYGNVPIKVFTTVDEAVAYARTRPERVIK